MDKDLMKKYFKKRVPLYKKQITFSILKFHEVQCINYFLKISNSISDFFLVCTKQNESGQNAFKNQNKCLYIQVFIH